MLKVVRQCPRELEIFGSLRWSDAQRIDLSLASVVCDKDCLYGWSWRCKQDAAGRTGGNRRGEKRDPIESLVWVGCLSLLLDGGGHVLRTGGSSLLRRFC